MGDQQAETPDLSDISPEKVAKAVADISEQSQRLVLEFLNRQSTEDTTNATVEPVDPMQVIPAFADLTAKMLSDPAKVMLTQMEYWQDYMALWQQTTAKLIGSDDVTAPSGHLTDLGKDDRRFRDDAWEDNEIFNYIKQSYLLTSRWVNDTVHSVDGLDNKTAQKVDFYTRQYLDALSPTNFAMTNPEVLRETAETGGENLLNGLKNLLGDMERGKGKLAIRMTDTDAFEVGRNIATTPGKVVFENDLMQLIQYEPTTKTVAKRPLLITPPWINKFYILDMREQNSFIKWALDQGNTVFVISWVNPDARLRDKGFEDYMLEGPLAALDAIKDATGEEKVNAVGYCIGGTLLSATLAYMADKGDKRISSATFFTTLVDFTDAGELSVFVDDEQVSALEETISERGFLEGSEMAGAFNLLRANDLIWSFVINNYLLGKDPFPFDLLYWNSDSTRMPAAMHGFYLRNMYLNNVFKDPAGVTLNGVDIDHRKIKTPAYILSTKDDHIAPWKSTYASTQLYDGPVRFVLAASGHIAGVVNPPIANKYCHWEPGKGGNPSDPDAWMAKATQKDGSWWPDWNKWLKKHKGGKTVPARKPGDGKLSVIEEAPGRYVKVRSDGD